jgi:hypothetical protein
LLSPTSGKELGARKFTAERKKMVIVIQSHQNSLIILFPAVPGPPAEVKLLATSPDTALVTWMPPKQPNGEIQKYYIYVRVMDSNGRKVEPKVVPSTSSEYEIRDLRKRHRYEVWVAALTRIGEGPGSPVASFMPTSKGKV